MGVSVDWHRGRRDVVCYTIEGKWDWDELYERRTWVHQQMAQSTEKISVIVDLRATKHVPPNVLLHMRTIARNVSPNHSGVSIFITKGVILAIYEKALRQLSPSLRNHKIHFVGTIEEADQILRI